MSSSPFSYAVLNPRPQVSPSPPQRPTVSHADGRHKQPTPSFCSSGADVFFKGSPQSHPAGSTDPALKDDPLRGKIFPVSATPRQHSPFIRFLLKLETLSDRAFSLFYNTLSIVFGKRELTKQPIQKMPQVSQEEVRNHVFGLNHPLQLYPQEWETFQKVLASAQSQLNFPMAHMPQLIFLTPTLQNLETMYEAQGRPLTEVDKAVFKKMSDDVFEGIFNTLVFKNDDVIIDRNHYRIFLVDDLNLTQTKPLASKILKALEQFKPIVSYSNANPETLKQVVSENIANHFINGTSSVLFILNQEPEPNSNTPSPYPLRSLAIPRMEKDERKKIADLFLQWIQRPEGYFNNLHNINAPKTSIMTPLEGAYIFDELTLTPEAEASITQHLTPQTAAEKKRAADLLLGLGTLYFFLLGFHHVTQELLDNLNKDTAPSQPKSAPKHPYLELGVLSFPQAVLTAKGIPPFQETPEALEQLRDTVQLSRTSFENILSTHSRRTEDRSLIGTESLLRLSNVVPQFQLDLIMEQPPLFRNPLHYIHHRDTIQTNQTIKQFILTLRQAQTATQPDPYLSAAASLLKKAKKLYGITSDWIPQKMEETLDLERLKWQQEKAQRQLEQDDD